MLPTDVITAETLAVIDEADEEEMRDFRNALNDAAAEIDNALYELTVVFVDSADGGGA